MRGVGTGEMVAIGTSSSASLNQAIAEAGFRAPLVLRAQDSKFVWDMVKRDVCDGMEKNHQMIRPPLYPRPKLRRVDAITQGQRLQANTTGIAIQYTTKDKH